MKHPNPSTAAKLKNATLPVSQNFPKFPISDENSANDRIPNDIKVIIDNGLHTEEAAKATSCSTPPPGGEAASEATLAERQVLALQLLLEGYSDTDVAREIGVDRRTIYNWRQSPDFAGELRSQTEELRTAVTRRMISL